MVPLDDTENRMPELNVYSNIIVTLNFSSYRKDAMLEATVQKFLKNTCNRGFLKFKRFPSIIYIFLFIICCYQCPEYTEKALIESKDRAIKFSMASCMIWLLCNRTLYDIRYNIQQVNV